MKIAHASIATASSLFLHVMLGYALFSTTIIVSKPLIQKVVITDISFVEEPRPLIQKERVKPIEEPKPLELPKNEPPPKVISKTVAKPKPVKEPLKSATPLEIKPTQDAVNTPHVTAPAPSNVKETPQSVQQPAPAINQEALNIYLYNVRQKIQEALQYPTQAKRMGIEGETIVKFLIHANGLVQASSIKVTKSSGKSVLDRSAIAAVMDALPFELPPKEAIEISIPVVFKLKS